MFEKYTHLIKAVITFHCLKRKENVSFGTKKSQRASLLKVAETDVL